VLMVNCMSSAQSLSCSKRLGAMGVLTVCTVVLILHEFFFGCLFWLMKQTKSCLTGHVSFYVVNKFTCDLSNKEWDSGA